MRDQGRLVEWFDDQGYGFIQPDDLSKSRVFLHIKDFAQRGPRPIVGCALDYVVIIDERGRFRAKQVVYLKASQTKNTRQTSQLASKPHSSLHPITIVIGMYALFLLVAIGLKALPSWLLLYSLLINALCYWQYAQDKRAAQQNLHRVPEQTLHLLSLLGGWPAAWFAQQKLRHKTQKQPFRQIYFATIVLNIMLLCALIVLLPKFMH
ncbi:DUF1294 domain-containing protein [Acinetobacter sp. ANC 4641]|uniref:DUF1294 domain-containing protein n=1 Tax=Acinetobacter sp. ANC 4641 TaxID=2529847 RepID=UPI00103EE9EF|nr:DUF1294 domain-containing protein [Acinetobacter sp. ANC 4641]TCB13594.1 DUF1294 domain-containing protein [Acinetobacter sp. ANC 4641]